MRTNQKPIIIDDRQYQEFCLGGYVERDGNKSLTEMQRKVRHKMSACEGDKAKAAAELKITRQCLMGHIAHIIAKGWSI